MRQVQYKCARDPISIHRRRSTSAGDVGCARCRPSPSLGSGSRRHLWCEPGDDSSSTRSSTRRRSRRRQTRIRLVRLSGSASSEHGPARDDRGPTDRERNQAGAADSRVRIRISIGGHRSNTGHARCPTSQEAEPCRWRAFCGRDGVVSSRSRAALVACRCRTFSVLRTARHTPRQGDANDRC